MPSRVRSRLHLLELERRTVPSGDPVVVSTLDEFRAAVVAAGPGTEILVQPGTYGGNNWFGNVTGVAGAPVVIAAADPAHPPVFRGGTQALQFTVAAYLELRDLIVEGTADNGINIDDGGTPATPAHDVTLTRVTVRNIGSGGNEDGIKLTGLDHFQVVDCTLANWGAGGSGIDMVGCHDGVVEGSSFHQDDPAALNGVEMKGGSAGVAVRNNRFDHAGVRAVQIGGSTELIYFRPQPPPGYEAANVTVEGNVIVGSETAVAFVNADGATVRFNTIVDPGRWPFRILQETTAPGFVPTRNGAVTDNIVVFRSDRVATMVNVGSGTAPATFQFARNWWYAQDNPALSTPALPTAETGGTSGIDPAFVAVAVGDYRLRAGSPAAGFGAYPVPVPVPVPADAPPARSVAVAVGADAGGQPLVRLFDAAGAQVGQFDAFPGGFSGGVRIASADVNGDGVPDVIVGTGPGSPTRVRVLDGRSGAELGSFAPFEAAFTGGVYVATGDLTGDGVADVVVTPDQGGGPRVQVYDGRTLARVADFFGIDDPRFRGGARAAVGDINGDGVGDLLVAAGFGGGPRVAAFDGRSLATTRARLFDDFFLFEPALRNGAFVALGDIDGDGKADLIGGGGPGGGPRVSVLGGKDLLAGRMTVLANFYAGSTASRGGIRVSVRDLDGDRFADVVVGDGAGAGSRVTAYYGKDFAGGSPPAGFAFDAYPGFTGGVFVG